MGGLVTAVSAIFLAIGGFLFGYDSGIISSTIVQPNFISYFGSPTASQSGGIVSSFQGGAILGALSVSWLADILGRVRGTSSLPRSSLTSFRDTQYLLDPAFPSLDVPFKLAQPPLA